MGKTLHEDVSNAVLSRMKESGFDFARVHPIEFYAIFPSEEAARRAARSFQGESLNAQVSARSDGSWNLQVSKVMFATRAGLAISSRGWRTWSSRWGACWMVGASPRSWSPPNRTEAPRRPGFGRARRQVSRMLAWNALTGLREAGR